MPGDGWQIILINFVDPLESIPQPTAGQPFTFCWNEMNVGTVPSGSYTDTLTLVGGNTGAVPQQVSGDAANPNFPVQQTATMTLAADTYQVNLNIDGQDYGQQYTLVVTDPTAPDPNSSSSSSSGTSTPTPSPGN